MFKIIPALCIFLFSSFAFASDLESNTAEQYETQLDSVSLNTIIVCECWGPCIHPMNGVPDAFAHYEDMRGEVFVNLGQMPIQACREVIQLPSPIPKNCHSI